VVLLFALLYVASATVDDKLLQAMGSPILAENAEDVRAFWTPERMKRAKPADMDKPFNVTAVLEKIDPKALPGRTEGGKPAKMDSDTMNETSVLYPCSFIDGYAPTYSAYPWVTIGKIFFYQGGVEYVCSGASINNYGIVTAGHCVYSLSLGQWSSNFIFIPAYQAGYAPYGSFSAYQLWVLTSYITTGSECYDYAFVATCSYGGYTVGQWVGWLGMSWNAGLGQYWTSLGYPQAAPFDGNWNYWASAYLCDQDSSCTFGIGSQTTGGASGGPWVIGWPTGLQVNGVNAYKYISPPQPLEIYSPYFDANVYTVYSAAFATAPTC